MAMLKKTARRRLLLAVSLGALIGACPAFGAEAPPPSTLSMLEAMVAGGVLTQEQADNILKDAAARDAAKAARVEAPPPLPEGTRRVTYVPEIVKTQLRDEIKAQVMAQAKEENWAAPNSHPEWSERIRFSGDVRGRYEGIYYPKGNSLGSVDVFNYSAANALSTPLDLNSTSNTKLSYQLPQLNADQPRERERLRARLGVDADLGEGFNSAMRFATGDSNSPVTTNQTLGGSGGNFSKYQLWLDRAYIGYRPYDGKDGSLGVKVGRFENPFFSSDLVWDDDLNFDGIAMQGSYRVAKSVKPFFTAGAFPVYNTDLNFSTSDSAKINSNDKWLYGLQAGTDWKAAKDVNVKVGTAYYYFRNVEGKPADCYYLAPTCVSDLTRPSFAQKGNTYIELRRNTGDTTGNGPGYQYYGLATPFRELAVTGKVDYDGFKSLRVTADAEGVKNLAFNKTKIQSMSPQNNLSGSTNTFEGGNLGYLARLTVGTPTLASRWDWNVSAAYKYIESDAVVDGFTDSDFGMGGTNLKGFMLGGNLAVSRNVWLGARWLSADAIAGTPYSVDVVQLDLTARF